MKKTIFCLTVLSLLSFVQVQGQVSDVIMWEKGKAYFFSGSEYIRYDVASDKPDAGYPMQIAKAWKGLWPSGIGCSVNWGNGKAYFFKGSEFIRYDIATDKADPGYPKPISSAWKGLWTYGIDAAVNWGNGKVYFFKGNEYMRYDIAADKVDEGFPKPILSAWKGLWPGLFTPFGGGIDAAVNWGNGKVYFFKGNEYIRYDIAADKADDGYPQQISTVWKLPFTGDAMTDFSPAYHGFHFNNTFQATYALVIPVHGLCGGMVYSALDYYNTGKPIPSQRTRPADHTPLADYFYNRWKDAYESNFDKWAELTVNPFGARNGEFFNWGLQSSAGGRIQELRDAIDNGKFIPLGLFAEGNGGVAPHHVVLAIGYNMGTYSGDLSDSKANKETFKIYVYNPNNFDKVDVLRVNAEKQYYYLESKPSAHYLSYFVDKKYTVKTPPDIH